MSNSWGGGETKTTPLKNITGVLHGPNDGPSKGTWLVNWVMVCCPETTSLGPSLYFHFIERVKDHGPCSSPWSFTFDRGLLTQLDEPHNSPSSRGSRNPQSRECLCLLRPPNSRHSMVPRSCLAKIFYPNLRIYSLIEDEQRHGPWRALWLDGWDW